jgi:hypothetical protein
MGKVFTDESPIAQMRDPYVLNLFSLSSCSMCLDSESTMLFMHLLPWAFQDEVTRRSFLSHGETQSYVVALLLSFTVPSTCGWCVAEIAFRHYVVVTFTQDSDWPRIVNSATALIEFIRDAGESSCVSRFITHPIENFFSFLLRGSLGDDRLDSSVRIITNAILVYQVMHELGLEVKHSYRDSIPAMVVTDVPVECTEEMREFHFQSLIHVAHLGVYPICHTDVSAVSNRRITATIIGE